MLGGVPRGFAYDAAGNLLQDDGAAYTYDDFNRTVKAETFAGNIQINHYDAEGLRHEMEENGRLVQFIFNTEREVVTETEGNVTNRLIRGSALIARTTDAECARTYYHYAADEMGSITHLTDEDGKVLNRYGYDAWGVSTVCEEQVENRFRYTGEQFDAITKQYYLRARFYNPVIARFTQEDTYRGDGLNLYAYCANNPVGYVDPSGHQPQCVKDAAAKYMAEGLGKEEAYRKAYQNHAKQKLANAASLPVQERIKLEERARRLGLEVDSSVNREKNPEAKMPDAEQRDKGGSSGRESGILSGYYQDANGSWHRPNGQFASNVEVGLPNNSNHYLYRPYIRKAIIDAVNTNTRVDYKTGKIYDEISDMWVDPSNVELGHKTGYEFAYYRDWAESQDWTQSKFNDFMNDPNFYAWQDVHSNRIHKFEAKH